MCNVISRGLFFYIFDDLWWKVIVRLIDIDGIVDHHCLNLLYILVWYCMRTLYVNNFLVNSIIAAYFVIHIGSTIHQWFICISFLYVVSVLPNVYWLQHGKQKYSRVNVPYNVTFHSYLEWLFLFRDWSATKMYVVKKYFIFNFSGRRS